MLSEMALPVGRTHKYALVGPRGQVDRIQANIDPTVGTKAGWRWLPFVLIEKECGVDQVREIETLTVFVDKVVREQMVRTLTALEIDERDQKARADKIDAVANFKTSPLIRTMLGEVRAKQLTDEEWRAFVEGALSADPQ